MVIDIDTVKEYLGITSTATDALLTLYANLVEGEIGAYIGYPLAVTTHTNEVLHYDSSRFDGEINPELDLHPEPPALFVDNWPVITVTSFTSQGVAVSTASYSLNQNTGVISLNSYIDDSNNALLITYTAGYTDTTLPYALQMVILEGVKALYVTRNSSSQSSGAVKSKKVGDYAVTYADTTSMVNNSILKNYIAQNKVILDSYRRVDV